MSEDDGFWLPRPCFVPPLPEHDLAADLLAQAADALLNGAHARAAEFLAQADMPVLYRHTHQIMNTTSEAIHRLRKVPGAPAVTKAQQRMPGADLQRALFARDGHRCRFCGCRVVLPKARDRMRQELPGRIRFAEREGFHAAFYALSASIDHIVPHSRGGGNEMDNLVVACWSCQFGRGGYLLEEVGLIDPRERAPVVDGWDGLGRVLKLPRSASASPAKMGEPKTEKIPKPAERSTSGKTKEADRLSIAKWYAEMNRIDSGQSGRLIAMLDSLCDLNIEWSLKKVLLIKLNVGGEILDLMGIEPNGAVVIPWAIGKRKREFRIFAEYLSAGINGTQTFESEKHWIVKMSSGQRPTVQHLIEAAPSLRLATEKLHAALQASS